ncbi:DUF222 domain-containing protein [Gordonia sp. L191]|uniref:HNH endonuclease n=1 Tax=Gordonia sp. L191 TaxID=2982699 RepID=UPI0024C0AAD5|nr:HNH endonuclease signature motif containing protein [Gordonia sp. L191]WHU46023.1 DUF222 domain-containing protein [Gordonia sp. L191]
MIDTTTILDVKDVDAEAVFATIVTQLSDLQWNPDMTGPQAFGAMKQVLLLRNLVDHHATTLTGELDRLGVADHKTTRLRELLISMGFAPSVAGRYVRISATSDIDLLLAHAADGAISSEHTDAIVRGLAHIDTRSPEPLDTVHRCEYLRKLLSHYFAGFTPAEINLYARQLGNELAADTPGGLPAAEDKRINSYTDRITDDGRLEISANLDIIAGEKTRTLMETLSAPKPQPDGSPYPRTPEQICAAAFETIVELAAQGLADTTFSAKPTNGLLWTWPADNPALGRDLQNMGPITEATAKLLSCDTTITKIMLDPNGVPLSVGQEKRFFTPGQRKALLVRDRGCIKCGAHAGRCQAHHVHHWADGGPTDLDNGCLLCTSCHDDVHHHGWDIIIGYDRHPWLIPPASIDPKRQPVPSYHRRTMRLDDAAA